MCITLKHHNYAVWIIPGWGHISICCPRFVGLKSGCPLDYNIEAHQFLAIKHCYFFKLIWSLFSKTENKYYTVLNTFELFFNFFLFSIRTFLEILYRINFCLKNGPKSQKNVFFIEKEVIKNTKIWAYAILWRLVIMLFKWFQGEDIYQIVALNVLNQNQVVLGNKISGHPIFNTSKWVFIKILLLFSKT